MKRFSQFVSEATAIRAPHMLKAFFLAGGPGSGKSSVASDVFQIATHGERSVSAFGLVYTSSDIWYEKLLRDNGIDAEKLNYYEKHEPAKWAQASEFRKEAKRLTDAQRNQTLDARMGIVFDGTGEDYNEKVEQKAYAESKGYDCYMVFVQTPLELALLRNQDRTRVLPVDLVTKMWTNVEANRPKYEQLYGDNFHQIHDGDTRTTAIKRYVIRCLTAPVQNPIGRSWLASKGFPNQGQ